MQTSLVRKAQVLAEHALGEELPRRWGHVKAVAAKAQHLASLLKSDRDRDVLVAAALLHDVGYASSLAESGFHPLDGGRWLRSIEFDDRVASLVAHHTNAVVEAELRGLVGELTDEFEREESEVADLLWYCDLTTGPDGQNLSVDERIKEIRERYEPESVVRLFIDRSVGTFHEVAKRVEGRMPPTQPM